MKRIDFFERGNIAPVMLVASAFVGLITVMSFALFPEVMRPEADIRIEPKEQMVQTGETFVVQVMVDSFVPTNVFAGELNFDPEVLTVESIDYNTSIADLWAELPWYSDGDGSLNFGGGTTHRGGFKGSGELLRITFRTLKEGDGVITLKDPRILLHDGLGTDAVLEEPLDSIITVEDPTVQEQNLIVETDIGTSFHIVPELPSTDLNGDGKISIADVSIFIRDMGKNDVRYDFNGDGNVDLKDFNILLGSR